MKRYGSIIGVRPEKLEEYKKLHAAVWPEVLQTICECNIRNYSIYYKDGLLFSYYEYVGTNYEADMKKMAADPVTQKCGHSANPANNRSTHAPTANGGP